MTTRCRLTMRSSGPRGQAIVFPDVVSARGRLTRRWASLLATALALTSLQAMASDFIQSHSAVSGRHAIVELEGSAVYLYLTEPERPVPERDVLVFSVGPLVSVEEAKAAAQSGRPPPLAASKASALAVQSVERIKEMSISWSASGESVAVLLNGEPWAFVSANDRRGYSRAVGSAGFYGEPWSDEAFLRDFPR
jgi:hypothetical protein